MTKEEVSKLKEEADKAVDSNEPEIPGDIGDMMSQMLSMFGGGENGTNLEEMMAGQIPKIKFIKTMSDTKLPTYGTKNSSGFDLYTPKAFNLNGGERKIIDTGLKVADIQGGFEIQVRPRSGLAAKEGVTVLNTPGTIDNDYRGNLMVILYNTTDEIKTFKMHDRIAQCVPQRVERVELSFVEESEESSTNRGEGGLGSTGD